MANGIVFLCLCGSVFFDGRRAARPETRVMQMENANGHINCDEMASFKRCEEMDWKIISMMLCVDCL